jgi:hypothetical protein
MKSNIHIKPYIENINGHHDFHLWHLYHGISCCRMQSKDDWSSESLWELEIKTPCCFGPDDVQVVRTEQKKS